MNLLEISVDDIQDFLNERKGLSHRRCGNSSSFFARSLKRGSRIASSL
jgi:hypothetical protein